MLLKVAFTMVNCNTMNKQFCNFLYSCTESRKMVGRAARQETADRGILS